MKKKRTKVRWVDHHSDSSWKSEKEIKTWAIKPNICTSIGWITYEDDFCIVLSSSFDGDDQYGENMCILKTCIVK